VTKKVLKILPYGKNQKKMSLFGILPGEKEDQAGI